jgi:hypothetical protein
MDLNYLKKYKAGFLEEAASTGLAFINPPPNNPIASIKLCGPEHLVKRAYIANISITKNLEAPLKFKCDVFGFEDAILFQHSDFEINCNENLVGPRMVHGVIFNNSECYLTYSVRLNEDYSTLPIGAEDAAAFYLSPFALEPYVGDVKELRIANPQQSGSNLVNIDVQPLNAGNGRLLTFNEGYNYDLAGLSTFQVPRFSFTSVAGAGAGRQPCLEEIPSNAEYITSINGAIPNEIGAITLKSNNDCLGIEAKRNSDQQGVLISAHCAPCCRCADYNSTAKFIRSYATIYAKMAKEYTRLVKLYNSINTQVLNQTSCCDTHNKMNARFKIWPQQNFMVQVQALMENNYKKAVCVCNTKLLVTLETESSLEAVETVENTLITHRIDSGTRLLITPMEEASYVYFKNINPGNQVQVKAEGVGAMSVSVDLEAGNLPIAIPCSDNDAGSLPANCLEPCNGYLMLTAGFTITDPKFRRIMHVLQQNAENNNQPFDGIELPIKIEFGYLGTPPAAPCGGCSDSRILPPGGVRRLVKISPNRRSVNPCAPVRLQSIEGEPGDYYARFPEGTTVRAIANTSVELTRTAYIADTQEWATIEPPITIPINTGVIFENKISIPASAFESIPSGAVGLSFTVSTTGQDLVSDCYPDPNNPEVPQSVNVAPSSATYSIRL